MRARHLALAAILLVSLSGCDVILQSQQGTTIDKIDVATDAAVRATMSAAQVAVATYTVANPGTLPTVEQLADYGYTATEGVELAISGTADDFCVQATAPSGTIFHATPAGGVGDGPC